MGKPASQINVSIVFDNLDLSGAEKIALNLLRNTEYFTRIKMSGLICMDDRLRHTEVTQNLTLLGRHRKFHSNILARCIKAFCIVFELRRATANADILIGVTPPSAVMCWLASLGTNQRVIAWVHYNYQGTQRDKWPRGSQVRGWIQRVLYLKVIQRFKNIIFVSEQCLESFPRPKSHAAWRVLPNIFESEPFLPGAPSVALTKMTQLKSLGIPVFVFLGRIARQKRWEDAIRVAEILRRSNFYFHLLFIGDGIERLEFLAALEASEAKEYMHYVGPDGNPKPALALSDGLILTSLFEAWPTVILEAFAARVPVFAYDCPSGPKEMLGEDTRGILSKERPESLADGIIRYFHSEADYRAVLKQNALDFLLDFYPWNAVPLWEAALTGYAEH